jgi:hypothetical protein
MAVKDVKLAIEELEERIAPDATGANPVPAGANPQPSGGGGNGNPSHNPVPAGANPQPSGHH